MRASWLETSCTDKVLLLSLDITPYALKMPESQPGFWLAVGRFARAYIRHKVGLRRLARSRF